MLNGFGPDFFDDNGEPVPGASAYLDENTWSVPIYADEPQCPEGMFHDEWVEFLEAQEVNRQRKEEWKKLSQEERLARLEAEEIPF